MKRYICIHGHFYQPPRENPWLEAIEQQDSAYPYHDWNERVAAECYAPNATSRIFDGQGRIREIVNNYSRISFNYGPTLLSWLEEKASDVYERILEADAESAKRFSGHGSALAQAYNHLIMPLADRRDKVTQVVWGIRDFEHRFGRRPEGMWLPETAVDLETLEILAAQGIRFTILAPHQARRLRKKGDRKWQDVSGGRIDPTTAYEQVLPSGGSIALFFYDGPISQAIAFERLLTRGEDFAHRLTGAFSDRRDWPQLVHIATDGETYGHHHRFGDMALAYALHYMETNRLAELTNYGEFLERFPPTHQVDIQEETSWSCVHGIGRWERDCGCHTGGRQEWNQAWREPLRTGLDWLRDALAPRFEEAAAPLLGDPWAARDDYINVVLDRSPENLDQFFQRHAGRALTPEESVTALKLLEMQRHAMLMYTSCGWFFAELSGIETVQVIQYAGRALQLGQELFHDHLEEPFLTRLERSRSNIPEHGTGRDIFENWVRPTIVDLRKVGAHFAISSLFEPYADRNAIYCYTVRREVQHEEHAGKARLTAGRARIVSRITRESCLITYAAMLFGDHNLHGGVRDAQTAEDFAALKRELLLPFKRGDLTATIQRVDHHFSGATYSVKSLFRDEQRRIVERMLESTLEVLELEYRQIFENYAPMMRFLADLGVPIPGALRVPGEFVTNNRLRRAFGAEHPDPVEIRGLLQDAREEQLQLDAAGLEFALRGSIEKVAHSLVRDPDDLTVLARLEALVEIALGMPFQVNLRKPQDLYWDTLQDIYPLYLQRRDQGEERAKEWIERFLSLGTRLSLAVETGEL